MIDKKILRNGLIFGIIFLFICLSFTFNICGFIGKQNIKSTWENPINPPLNNDFLNAYWKFDECDGKTLEDSSGNNYDGAVYESSWITGKSGCALDFDGMNDFVELDAHSVDLGFNKTDDLIISLWFKSVSTNGGYIYCISGLDHVPEARIDLCPNGSLNFKVWTSVCGIEAFSEEGHNDGVWHHAEIFFNGITAKPTMEIYIDDKLEGNKTR